jgi:hypothetical protein
MSCLNANLTRLKYLRLELYMYKSNKERLKNEQLTTTQYTYISTTINAIEATFKMTKSQERIDFIKFKYFENTKLSLDQIANKFFVHENTIKNWDYNFLDLFASILGLTKNTECDTINITARR